jgi:hypothetical protein
LYTPVRTAPSMRIQSTAGGAHSPATVQPGGSQTVTLLLDPRAAVHVTTGLLPVQTLRIPPDVYAASLAALRVGFLAAPVLLDAARPHVPVPAETGFEWSWTTVGAPDRPLRPAQGGSDAHFPDAPPSLVDGWLTLKRSATP